MKLQSGLARWLKSLTAGSDNMTEEIFSPNRQVVCVVRIIDGRVYYEVRRLGRTIVGRSRLGFSLKGEGILGEDFRLVRKQEKKVNEVWETRWGEQREITNNFREVVFYLAEKTGKKRLMTLRFRVFDEGVAFRYELPPQPRFQRLIVLEELTEFNFDLNSQVWQIPAYRPDRYEYNYEKVLAMELTKAVHTPLTIETPQGGLAVIHEAALYDYGAMNIALGSSGKLVAEITPLSSGMKAYLNLPFNTPWRMIMLAEAPIELVTNRMMLNLNSPEKQGFDFVRTLKFIGIWWAMYVGEWTWARGERHGATTEHMKEYLDVAKRLGIGGVLAEGWNNGWDGDWLMEGRENNFLRPVEDFNLEEISRYAQSIGVEIVGHHETVGFIDNYEKQLREAYDFYRKHGIKYIKTGYAGSKMEINGHKEYHHSQIGVRHYQRAVELAAEYGIMLNIHEPIKGTGIERTWPNLLTREGARGQEYEGGALKPSHACILPFTRLMAGGMDYTPGIFDLTNSAKRVFTTLARQLAYYVVFYSAMQMAADRPRFYEGVEAFEFIREVPLSFEKTVPLLGKIGEYYVVARQERTHNPLSRAGASWFVGGVTSEQARRVRLKLDFLGEGEYEAKVYRDGEQADYLDNPLEIVIEKKRVRKGDFLDVWMARGGGFALKIARV